VYDLPKALDATLPMNCLNFKTATSESSKYAFVSNIRVAAGAPDTRNKLITEGKFVTSGILFDAGSDKIRPESFGVLKDIANVLKENADVKVKIVGHTDSDGDDAKNMELSGKRAASVKASLNKEFGIDESRMQTEGKGETKPITPNTTPEGKANNRRVEFLKL
jgi:outer membrane protein OmpA-like peptidoglycan-associated protein